jgi:4-hydroxybenzoate polyprenyltransferase
MGVSAGLPDAAPRQWLARVAPDAWLPFIQLARLDRPIGWQLLLAPCWQSSALASLARHEPLNLWHLALFAAGAVAMRGAGSTFNDIADRDLDAQVERTRGRPLPSGRVSARAAALFLAAQCLVGLAVLLQFNGFAVGLGFASLLLVAVYPFMKRVTSWPQAVLGLAFSWGALMGWAALNGGLAAPALWLYASAIFWTIGYDTIYALQDSRDDAIAGIRSTARLFGARVRVFVATMYLMCIIAATLALLSAGAGILSYAGLCGLALHLLWQTRQLDAPSPALALKLFRANRDAGLVLFAGIAADVLVRRMLG